MASAAEHPDRDSSVSRHIGRSFLYQRKRFCLCSAPPGAAPAPSTQAQLHAGGPGGGAGPGHVGARPLRPHCAGTGRGCDSGPGHTLVWPLGSEDPLVTFRWNRHQIWTQAGSKRLGRGIRVRIRILELQAADPVAYGRCHGEVTWDTRRAGRVAGLGLCRAVGAHLPHLSRTRFSNRMVGKPW